MRKILTIATAIYFLFALVIGVNIFSNTQDKENQENDKYISAPVVTTGEEYLQQIGKGTKYIYMQGTLQALDQVTDAEIEPACLKIVKTKEKKSYRHGQTSHTYVGGIAIPTTNNSYSSWAPVENEVKVCSDVKLCGMKFPADLIQLPITNYKTILMNTDDKNIRYVYQYFPDKLSGTAFIDVENGMPAEDTIFYPEKTVEEVRKQLITDFFHPIMFCVSWYIKACVLYFVIFFIVKRRLS